MHPRLQALIPQRTLSHLVGALGRVRRPRWLVRAAISAFARQYDADLSEADRDLGDYPSFTDFFTRKLRPGARPLPEDPNALAWPADGAVAAGGTMQLGRMLQAKDIDYTAVDLLGDAELAACFEGGHYRTVYLSPRDYHRVHAPWHGRLVRRIHRPGRLYSVNDATVAALPGVFAGNERAVLVFEDEALGTWALVLVGALIIGGIETPFEGTLNPPPRGLVPDRTFDEDGEGSVLGKGKVPGKDNVPGKATALTVQRGDEVGLFRAGSTVITLFQPGRMTPLAATESDSVRMGQRMGRVVGPVR